MTPSNKGILIAETKEKTEEEERGRSLPPMTPRNKGILIAETSRKRRNREREREERESNSWNGTGFGSPSNRSVVSGGLEWMRNQPNHPEVSPLFTANPIADVSLSIQPSHSLFLAPSPSPIPSLSPSSISLAPTVHHDSDRSVCLRLR